MSVNMPIGSEALLVPSRLPQAEGDRAAAVESCRLVDPSAISCRSRSQKHKAEPSQASVLGFHEGYLLVCLPMVFFMGIRGIAPSFKNEHWSYWIWSHPQGLF